MADNFDNLLTEKRLFAPSKEFVKNANMKDKKIWEKAAKNPKKYWADWAKQLDWFKPFKTIAKGEMPNQKWFIGGKLNACYNSVDRHLLTSRRYKTAIIWQAENGHHKNITYYDLMVRTSRLANVLKKQGVKKGDRVAIYMGMIPELPIAALACARMGAIHSVIFGGFSPESIRDRCNDMKAKVIICADGANRKGGIFDLKQNVDAALNKEGGAQSVKKVLYYKHAGNTVTVKKGRDIDLNAAMHEASPDCPCEPMNSEDTLFLLYTSGSTGKPKGIQHSTAGYLTGTMATSKWVFDMKDDDLFWCTADVGWITGHSYLTYGPLLNGATCMIYEGTPDSPSKDIFWKIVERHGVTIFYTAPTAIRAFMKWGDKLPDAYKMKSLRLLGTVGEPINPKAWMWYRKHIGKNRCPIVDTWWQTETGAIMLTALPALVKTPPGSATRPFPGTFPQVVDPKTGKEVPTGKGGLLVYKKGWPSMLRTIWGDHQRYKEVYFSKFKNTYFAGDAARKDKNGNFWLMGRVDDVVNVSGHRIGTMEVESALVDHPAVAEAAVIGRDHPIKGQALSAFVIIKANHKANSQLSLELRAHVGKKIGAIAKPEEVVISSDLPKTRSGKIMRRLLRDIAEGRKLGDITTLADPTIVAGLQAHFKKK